MGKPQTPPKRLDSKRCTLSTVQWGTVKFRPRLIFDLSTFFSNDFSFELYGSAAQSRSVRSNSVYYCR
jgi:hypothetical protein